MFKHSIKNNEIVGIFSQFRIFVNKNNLLKVQEEIKIDDQFTVNIYATKTKYLISIYDSWSETEHLYSSPHSISVQYKTQLITTLKIIIDNAFSSDDEKKRIILLGSNDRDIFIGDYIFAISTIHENALPCKLIGQYNVFETGHFAKYILEYKNLEDDIIGKISVYLNNSFHRDNKQCNQLTSHNFDKIDKIQICTKILKLQENLNKLKLLLVEEI